MAPTEFDRILDKLAKDVESAVHAMYRGEVRQATAKARTDHLVHDARAALAAAASSARDPESKSESPVGSTRPSFAAPTHAGERLGWTAEDSDAVLKCITSWLPMGGPGATTPDMKCIAPAKMLIPTWGERERAREAVKRITMP